MNEDTNINAILVQLPLPEHISKENVINAIAPEKDVDGLTYLNSGMLLQKADGFIPCTPKGIIDLLDYYSIPIEGKNCLVIGRSVNVGKPLALLLLNK